MANVPWGTYSVDIWSEVETLYGPQPEIGTQVFGRPLDPEPIGLLREKANISLSTNTTLDDGVTADDNLVLQFGFAGSDLERYFIIPYHISIVLAEDPAAPGAGALFGNRLIDYGAWLRFFIQGDFLLPIYWATTPANAVLPSVKKPWLKDATLLVKSFDFGFPKNTSSNWANRLGVTQGNAGFSIYFPIRVTQSNITSWKPVSIRPRFEALLYDRTQYGHSAFYKPFVTMPQAGSREYNEGAFLT